jgi:hypothetical protein
MIQHNDVTFGQHYLSNMASSDSCVDRRVRDHRDLLDYSPLLKNTRVKQVVVDKWSPLKHHAVYHTAA